MAAVSATEQAQAKQLDKLEKIGGSPAATASETKDCPMQQAKKECMHLNGDPCPHHQNEKQHGKMQDKCEHKHPG